MKSKELLFGAAFGLLIGITVGFLSARSLSKPDHYTLQIMNQAVALKMNTRTGVTWRFNFNEGDWRLIGDYPINYPKTFIPDSK